MLGIVTKSTFLCIFNLYVQNQYVVLIFKHFDIVRELNFKNIILTFVYFKQI